MQIGLMGSSFAHELTPLGIYLFIMSQECREHPESSSLRIVAGDYVMGFRESRVVGAGLRKENP
jgi:hypothetical protein